MTISKILVWIKKHILLTILIGFGFFFIPLILVHIAYRIPAISTWFSSTWEAGELIMYIAGFEAFVGTVILGIIAVQQNEKANSLNKSMLESEEKHRIFERQPCLMIASWSSSEITVPEVFENATPVFSFDDSFFDNYFNHEEQELHLLLITFINTSKTYADFSIDRFVLSDYSKEVEEIVYSNISTSTEQDRFHVPPAREISLGFVLDKKMFENYDVLHANFGITINNSIGEQYSEIIEFSITKYYSVLIDGYYILPLINNLT